MLPIDDGLPKSIRDSDELELEDVGMKEAVPGKLPWYQDKPITDSTQGQVGYCVWVCS